MFSGFVLYLLFLSLKSVYSFGNNINNEELGKIIFANILFRHGDRTPINPYPNDPYRNESLWPVPFGQLTKLGQHQHLTLGMWFRKRYNHLIPKTYSLYDIYVRSTDVDRTLMSAESNLAGLYPPCDEQEWDIEKWMPIPIHTVPAKDDDLAGKKYCERYNYELEKVNNSPEILNLNKENEELFSYLSKMSGINITSLESLEYLYNNLYIEELYNKTLPDWTKNVYPDKMKQLANKSFTIQAYNHVLQKLVSGPLLKKMIENMVLKSKNTLTPDRKLWIFSGHDETVANMMNTLGVFEPHCPPYTATLLIELRINNKNDYFVTVSYKNSSTEPTILIIPGCTAACPLKKFVKLTQKVVPKNWERECLLGLKKYQYNSSENEIIVLLTITILMLIVTILMGSCYWLYRKNNKYYFRLSMDNLFQ